MSAAYEPVPTNAYPPNSPTVLPGPPYPLKPKRLPLSTIVKYVVSAGLGLVLLHYAFVGVIQGFRNTHLRNDIAYATAENGALKALFEQLHPDVGQPGTFFRDSYPIRSMLAFWELAQEEVESLGLDTCNDQLGKGLIEAYHRTQLDYCLPPGLGSFSTTSKGHGREGQGQGQISCAAIHRDEFSNWWPYPASPCISKNLQPKYGDDKKFWRNGCQVTTSGVNLNVEMGREKFLGTDLENGGGECKRFVGNRTMLVIGRQDQWNPFHVSEDLITTLVTVFIAARAEPRLVDTKVQIVFVEGFGMDTNHFTPLWDRIGAWAPRRLSLDPWDEGVCLGHAIHSVGAGASLLSAMGVGSSYTCASTITWAASHYYRHLFGLLPVNKVHRPPINILWLSRSKLDAYAEKQHDMSPWREMRHITNERELIKRLQSGLEALCEGKCEYMDAVEYPESWTGDGTSNLPQVRFAAIDPTVHALENQIHLVGHTSILVSSHGGALGLSLFLPPGYGSIVELQVQGVQGNFHFQHMAYEMGHTYDVVEIEQYVDVNHVWDIIKGRVLDLL